MARVLTIPPPSPARATLDTKAQTVARVSIHNHVTKTSDYFYVFDFNKLIRVEYCLKLYNVNCQQLKKKTILIFVLNYNLAFQVRHAVKESPVRTVVLAKMDQTDSDVSVRESTKGSFAIIVSLENIFFLQTKFKCQRIFHTYQS